MTNEIELMRLALKKYDKALKLKKLMKNFMLTSQAHYIIS